MRILCKFYARAKKSDTYKNYNSPHPKINIKYEEKMVMPKFTIKTQGEDPYRTFKFRIKIDNKYVAGLSNSNIPDKKMEVADRRTGGSPSTIQKLPEKKKSDAIIFTTGMTHDTTFQNWANQVNNCKGDAAMSLKNFRKKIIIDVFNEQNQKTISYQVDNCWVSEYRAVPDLDAGANVVMIQTMKLENEGWKRI